MQRILCRIFNFFLMIFTSVVEAIAAAFKIIGTAAVEVLSDLLDAGGSLLSKPLFWLVGGVAAWWFITKGDDDDRVVNRTQPLQVNGGVSNELSG